MSIISGILTIILIIVLLVWAISTSSKQAKKDWETLEDLEKKANKITSLDELVKFHLEFREKASKISNQYINPRLAKIDGYCRGMYQILKLK